MAASFGTRLNVGVLAVALAWLVAVFGAGWKADAVMAAFPVVALRHAARRDAAVRRHAGQRHDGRAHPARAAARAARRAGWLPLLLFAAGVRCSARWARAPSRPSRCSRRSAWRLARRPGVPPLLTALMLGNGANAGQPVALQRRRRDRGGRHGARPALPGHEWQVWAANFVAHALAAAVAWVLFGGPRLLRERRCVRRRPTWLRWPPVTGSRWSSGPSGWWPSCS